MDEAEPMETETEISSADEGEAMQIDEAPLSQDWRDQYLDLINRGVLPSDRAEARRVARRANYFIMIDRELYKRSPSGVLQRCTPVPKGRELLRDIHARVCGHHAAPRTLVGDMLLEICPRGNHISLYSWLIKCSLNIHG